MYKKTRTRFTKKIRIEENQLQWLKENKDCKTVAGFLDKIINHHKELQNLRYPQDISKPSYKSEIV